MNKDIFIGTSGYTYTHWRKVFYPPDLASSKWLEFYSQYFNSVELNVTFYRLPKKEVFKSWYKRTPKDFKFIVKGSRFITHIKRLKDCSDSLKIFFENVSFLKEKLACVLWQLPPSLKGNLAILKNFIKLLKKKYSFTLHSFEFRNQTWFSKETYQLLENNNINLCIADSPNFPTYEILTSSFIYLRFHGGKILYGSNYSEEEIKKWTKKVKNWLKKKNLLFAFFNNDAYGFAVKNALKFKELLEK
jgi:uncharacterized protein YecE (DUF72 family)